jgi:hypothetical protein
MVEPPPLDLCYDGTHIPKNLAIFCPGPDDNTNGFAILNLRSYRGGKLFVLDCKADGLVSWNMEDKQEILLSNLMTAVGQTSYRNFKWEYACKYYNTDSQAWRTINSTSAIYEAVIKVRDWGKHPANCLPLLYPGEEVVAADVVADGGSDGEHHVDKRHRSSQTQQGLSGRFPSLYASCGGVEHFSYEKLMSVLKADDTEEVAHGGFGKVFRATVDLMDVAVKVRNPDSSMRHCREAAWHELSVHCDLAHIAHPRLMPLHGYASQHRDVALVTPWMGGGTLHAALCRPVTSDEYRFSDVVKMAMQTADAIFTMHSLGYVHFDVKPCNIFLTSFGDAVLGDFGLAYSTGEIYNDNNEVLQSYKKEYGTKPPGTPGYMPPESMHGKVTSAQQRDQKTVYVASFFNDVFAFGISMMQVLAGMDVVAATKAIAGDDNSAVANVITARFADADVKYIGEFLAVIKGCTLPLYGNNKGQAKTRLTSYHLVHKLRKLLASVTGK